MSKIALLEKMLKLKQDDWLVVCGEIEALKETLKEKDEHIVELEGRLAGAKKKLRGLDKNHQCATKDPSSKKAP